MYHKPVLASFGYVSSKEMLVTLTCGIDKREQMND